MYQYISKRSIRYPTTPVVLTYNMQYAICNMQYTDACIQSIYDEPETSPCL